MKIVKILFASALLVFASGAYVFCDEYHYEDYTNGNHHNERNYYDEDEFKPGYDFEFGGGMATTVVKKTYAYGDVNFLYNFNEYTAFGMGLKEYSNLKRNYDEASVYYIPYAMYRLKILNIKAGGVISDENKYSGCVFTPYFDMSFSLPVWKVGSGKLGLEFGTEAWFSVCSVKSETPRDYGPEGLGLFAENLFTLIGTLINPMKVYAGVKYYL